MVGPNDQPMITKFTDAYSTNVVTYCSVQEHEEVFAMESRGYTFTSKPMDGGQRVDAEHIDRYAEFEKKKNKVTIGFKQLYKEPSKQSVELKDWRDKFTFEMAQAQCASQSTKFTMVSLHSGGLVDTLSAMRAGWTPIWGAEICPTHSQLPIQCDRIARHSNCKDNLQQQLWGMLTGTTCYGNAYSFLHKYTNLQRPMYLTIGPECIDFCIGGSKDGPRGATGWMTIEAIRIILMIKPLAVRIEQSGNITKFPEVLEFIRDNLSTEYAIHELKTQVWRYGDVNNRERWVLVGFLNNMGVHAQEFKFPEQIFNESSVDFPIARDLAVPDECVPAIYWRRDNTSRTRSQVKAKPIPGELFNLAKAGPGMGSSVNPNAVSSWDGLAPGPTTLGGAIRFPKIDWYDIGDNPVGPTRLRVPVEVPRYMSMPRDTIAFYAKVSDSEAFLKRNCNNGVPLRFCNALDNAIHDNVAQWLKHSVTNQTISQPLVSNYDSLIHNLVMTQCKTASDRKPGFFAAGNAATKTAKCSYNRRVTFMCDDINEDKDYYYANYSDRYQPRSALVDTGCNHTLLFTSIEPYLDERRQSRLQIQVADKGSSMLGSKDGVLRALVFGAEGVSSKGTKININCSTTKALHRELLSVDDFYDDGFNILLKQPDYEDGIPQMFRPASRGINHDGSHVRREAIKIPFRRGPPPAGGFFLDYLPEDLMKTSERCAYLAKFSEDMQSPRQIDVQFDPVEAAAEAQRMWAKAYVTEVFLSSHLDEREIKGVKAGLRRRKREMTHQEFHEYYDHMGACAPCAICILAGGTMRRIFHKVDPYKEVRPMHTIAMDTITWSHRAYNGSKYEIHFIDLGSDLPDSLFLYSRDESLDRIEDWITNIRSEPAFGTFGYEPVKIILLDNAGEWELDYSAFHEMGKRLQVEFRYSSKDRKQSSSHQERAIGVKEPKVKAALLQVNLPPAWWLDKSKEVDWLLARFPKQSMSPELPTDGDRMRPLESATNGFISRRQIDKELYNFVPVGTPVLVHDEKALGSQLPHSLNQGCKSSWMVARGMYRDQLLCWNPRTGHTTKTRSFTAFTLRRGMNFSQVIDAKMPKETARMRPLPGDFTEKVTIHLPLANNDVVDTIHPEGEPIQRVTHKNLEGHLAPYVTQTPVRKGKQGRVRFCDTDGKDLEVDETGAVIPVKETDSGRDVRGSCGHNEVKILWLSAPRNLIIIPCRYH